MKLPVYSVWTPGLKGCSLVTSLWKGKRLSRERTLWGCAQELWSCQQESSPLLQNGSSFRFSHHQKAFLRIRFSSQPLKCSKPSLSRGMGAHSLLSTDSEPSRKYHTQPPPWDTIPNPASLWCRYHCLHSHHRLQKLQTNLKHRGLMGASEH